MFDDDIWYGVGMSDKSEVSMVRCSFVGADGRVVVVLGPSAVVHAFMERIEKGLDDDLVTILRRLGCSVVVQGDVDGAEEGE